MSPVRGAVATRRTTTGKPAGRLFGSGAPKRPSSAPRQFSPVGPVAGVNAGNGSGDDTGSDSGGDSGSDTGSDSGTGGSAANGSGANKGGTAKGGGSEGDGIDHGAVKTIAIMPNFSTISVVDGKASPLPLQVFPTYADGLVGKAIVNASWSIDLGDVATVDGNGNVTATGFRGADVTVTAGFMGLTATAISTVKIVANYGTSDVSSADQMLLDAAEDHDPTAKVLYPYDGTTFPRGLAAPRVMWGGGSTSDVMSLTLSSQWLAGTYYFHASAPHALDMPPELWTLFTESGVGTQPATMRLARAGGGAATVIATEHWKLAAGSLRGTVYYWSNNLGRVVRIKPGAAAPDDFLAAAGVSDGCTTCHAVSARGNVLTLGGGIAGDSKVSVFDLGSQQVSASNRGRSWAMLALNPNGTVAALNNAPLPGGPGLDGGLYSVATGAKIMGTGADTTLFDMPSFAPDSSKLVYVDHDTHALSSYAFTDSDTAPMVSGQQSLVDQGSGDPIAFPSVSPDGAWAVYHRGSLDTRSGNGDLFLGALNAGSNVEIPLDNLNGKDYPFAFGDRDLHLNFEPTFLPVEAGDFFWVVFTSRRTLGNQLIGDRTQVKQLWVAAIEKSPTPGEDPSYAPFWVPGQEPTTLNMRGFWALDGCKSKGVSCEQTSECCGGAECLPASHTCDQAAASTCAQVGADCLKPADCCGDGQGFDCIENRCQAVKE